MSDTAPLRSAALPISWEVPEDIETIWANNMTIQLVEQSFLLTFYQTFPPLIVGDTPEALDENVRDIAGVVAMAKTRLVIPLQKLPDIIRVLSTTYEALSAVNVVEEEQ